MARFTETVLSAIGGEVGKVLADKLYSLATFIYREGVFNNARTEYVVEVLRKCNVSDSFLMITYELLTNRVIFAIVGRAHIKRRMCRGIHRMENFPLCFGT